MCNAFIICSKLTNRSNFVIVHLSPKNSVGMKKIFFLIVILLSIKSYSYVPSQSQVRVLFQQSAVKEDSCKKLIKILESYNEKNNALYAGYKACATMMMANYVFNPFRKMSYFSKGKNLLERSIEADKENVELRFLRFSIQNNIPSFLFYKGSINSDKTFLMKRIYALKDVQLKQMIVAFLKDSDSLTAQEKQKL